MRTCLAPSAQRVAVTVILVELINLTVVTKGTTGTVVIDIIFVFFTDERFGITDIGVHTKLTEMIGVILVLVFLILGAMAFGIVLNQSNGDNIRIGVFADQG